MARKRPLSAIDPNASISPRKRPPMISTKAPTLKNSGNLSSTLSDLSLEGLKKRADQLGIDKSGPKDALLARLAEAPDYSALAKPELQQECVNRELFKSGQGDQLIARLEDYDKARRMKYAKAKGHKPISREEAARRPIGVQRPPSEARKAFGPNDPVSKLERRGPRGAPVYDEQGFEVDYDKACTHHAARYRPSLGKVEKQMDKWEREEKRMKEIMGCEEALRGQFKDKVSRDLGIPFHDIEPEDWEEWKRRGFKLEPGEFESVKDDEEERERLSNLACGSAHRK